MKLQEGFASFVGDGLYNNNIFDLNSPQNRDCCYEPFFLLQCRFADFGVEINTADINNTTKPLFELHMDVQKTVGVAPAYLLLYETPQIRPLNQNNDFIVKYRRIFTWNDDLVDGQRYIKINIPNKIVMNHAYGWDGRDQLCCMIAGNKRVHKSSPLELYSERVKTIRWFENNVPNQFDLFGTGWDAPAPRPGRMGRIFNRLHYYLPQRKGKTYFQSYRGKIPCKHDMLKKYRFNICYENVRDLPGYITEKIFDSFFAGCVPVYWGASNISTYVPDDCYIDRRKFLSHKELYQFMASMSEQDYIGYQKRIATFLESDCAKPFNAEMFVETIVNTIVSDLGLSA